MYHVSSSVYVKEPVLGRQVYITRSLITQICVPLIDANKTKCILNCGVLSAQWCTLKRWPLCGRDLALLPVALLVEIWQVNPLSLLASLARCDTRRGEECSFKHWTPAYHNQKRTCNLQFHFSPFNCCFVA